MKYVGFGLKRHPFLNVIDFAKFLLESETYAPKLLAGHKLEEVAHWKSAFRDFWGKYKSLESGHEVFERHATGLEYCIPILLHGDEGTSFGKKGLFEFSWTPLLTTGASGINRYFMISQIPHKYYGKLSKGNEAGNPTLDAIMKAGVDSILLGFVNGIQCGGNTFYLVPLGLTGDHVFHALLARIVLLVFLGFIRLVRRKVYRVYNIYIGL